jgi:hypothetical protein
MPLPDELIARRGDRGERRSRLGDLIVLLASNSDGEALAAARALGRMLAAAGADHHDLVKHIEEPSLSERQIKLIQQEIDQREKLARDQGIAEGKQLAATQSYGGGDFHNTDGSDDWRRIATYVQSEKHRLPARNRTEKTFEFIDDMAMWARSPFSCEPTQKQGAWLYDLYAKLGGKIT